MLIILIKRISVLLFLGSLALCLWLSPPVNANTYSEVKFLDTDTGFEISRLNGNQEVNLPWHKSISVKVTPTKPTDKMRMQAQNSSSKDACQFDKISVPENNSSLSNESFVFTFEPKESATSCSIQIDGWKNPWNWLGKVEFKLNFSDNTTEENSNNSNSSDKVYGITVGTDDKSEMDLGSPGERSAHGVRIYCPVSHFSYDDPIVYPNKPGLSHLHMFVGNTSANASSTPTNLLGSGNSSCEGGTNIRSSYWTPAVFNNNNELVLPEQEFVYYKTFMNADSNYDNLQIIPNGLQMLATKSTLNAKEDDFPAKYTTKDGKEVLFLGISFPSCLATENGEWNGRPILSYQNMPGEQGNIVNSHVAYPGGPDKNQMGCPATHPYRTPNMSLKIYYDRGTLGEGWYLSSDMNKNQPGETLHGDYIAAWDPNTMEAIKRCNQEARSCDFDGGRGQLPERFKSPLGKKVYAYSTVLEDDVDRTPYGNLLKPRLN